MQLIGDLHVHSKYSSGASRNISLFNLALNSVKKGVNILGTGDCLHSSWLNDLKKNLIEYTDGIYYLDKISDMYFILQTEVELIWKHNGRLKKVHFLILFPNFETVDGSITFLSRFSDLRKNGRPKIYSSVDSFIYGLKLIDERIEIIPAHIFTPYFGIHGEKSCFESINEALGETINLIHAVETGLSADPFMISSISELNRFAIISNSDCHSMAFHRLGRESSVFNLNKLKYHNLIDSIRTKKIVKTYEFKPSAGKYYYDGHRKERHENKLDYCCSPKLKIKNCPYCNKPLTKGVLSRVYQLQDKKLITNNKSNFQYIVPLLSLISVILGGTEYDKENILLYYKIISNNVSEYNIWEGESNFKGLSEDLISAINNIRRGNFWFIPGFDSIYGKLHVNI
jgi:uncharacterized protein (TIGR00375 family)